MPEKQNRPGARCSFCGHFASEIGPMVEGPADVYICRKCVAAAQKIYEEMDLAKNGERAVAIVAWN